MAMTNAFNLGEVALSKAKRALVERREKCLGPAYKLFYQDPVHVVRGQGVWLYDQEDNAYLDVYNNVPSVGHCHPHVIAAMTEQAEKLNTHSRYLHENILNYSEHLLSTFTAPLNRYNTMFTCTGSEANDLALRIAKYHTGGQGIIVTDLAYHGGTELIASLSPSLGEHVALGKCVRTIPAPNMFRCKADVGSEFARHVQAAIADLQRHGIKPAALLVDTIFSSDGVFAEPAGFLKKAADAVQAAGGLFIADEVQAGFARLGETFWGFERHGVTPDIVTMGKGMGGGHPLAGLVARPALVDKLGQSRYFNTTGGTPVSMAIGKAVLEVIEEESLQNNALNVGTYIQAEIRKMMNQFDVIGDVRGSGLFIGIEMVTDSSSNAPSGVIATGAVNGLRQKRILISSAGPDANILKVRPPLPFTMSHADQFLQGLVDVLKNL